MSNHKHIGIVGGGILGLTLALRLNDQGFRVTLLEAGESIGGLTRPTQIGDYVWDQFYHVILMSDESLLELINRLGLSDRLKSIPTKSGFLNEGHLYSMSNIMEFLNFPLLGLLDKIRLGLTVLYASKIKSHERLEKILVEDWLIRFSGERTFNKIWLPLLKSKLGDYYKITSASFIWASINRMYKARRTGLKREMFGYIQGGYATILNRFQKVLNDLNVQILCKRHVTRVTDDNKNVKVMLSTGETLKFNNVILTLPCDEIPIICPQISIIEKKRFGKVIYEGVICVMLLLKKKLGGYYITNIIDGWVPFTAIIEMTAVVDNSFFGGNSLVYLPRYVSIKDPLWNKADQEIQEDFERALRKIYPKLNKKDILDSKVIKAKKVLPITTLNYSKQVLPPIRTSMKNVFTINSAQIVNGTMNVNEIVGLANKKAKEIEEAINSMKE